MAIGRGRVLVFAGVLGAGCGPKASEPETAQTDAADEDTGAASGIVGVWVGYTDQTPLPSDRIEIAITEVDPEGGVTGTVVFGEAGTIVPAVDPEAGYPPGYMPLGAGIDLIESFPYALTGTFDDGQGRLEATLEATEVWGEWCGLQTSYAWGEDSYGCLPNCGFGTSADACTLDDCPERPGAVDCTKLALCGFQSVCLCDAQGCINDPGNELPLDLHLDADQLDGPIEQFGTAYLSRQ